ncbi:MAG: pantoate--beta-alanine ligase [Bacteroidetes bacterium]|nr:pantoate--beta-alanine ligase [Bacteroidota bacterium]
MIIFKKVVDIQQYIKNKVDEGAQIGFVPTMGALHEGHISLICKAKQEARVVVTSIFVNPTQFNDKEDFEKYPVSIEQDMAMLIDADCDVLFIPSVSEMYPNGTDNMPAYDFGYLETVLEGTQRPGHFKGVGQVVARLLDIVNPHYLYMGQKDYQQCMVVGNLLKQLNSSIRMVICPTERDDDGLAMSSRNRRLTEPQRAIAGLLYQCLVSIQAKKDDGSFDIVKKECEDLLKAKGFNTEYISLADAETLELLNEYNNNRKMVALIAAKIGVIRLIDNLLLN